MAATMEDYLRLADKAEYLAALLAEVNAAADTLHVPIPQQLARAWADIMTWPDLIRAEGARRTGTWPDPPIPRHDEDPDPQETP